MSVRIFELTKTLKEIHDANYRDCRLVDALREAAKLSPSAQETLIFNITSMRKNFDDYLEYVRRMFFVLKQNDEEGQYCALGFGDECISVATWDEDFPDNVSDIDFTSESATDPAQCRYLEDFMKFWLSYFGADPIDFLSDL